MHPDNVENLINKYLEGSASTEEVRRVDAWYNSFDAMPPLFNNVLDLAQIVEKSFGELSLMLGLK